MTPTTSAVRAACDAVRHGVTGPGEIPYCSWPRCGCELSDALLSTLLANARAEGAAGEREAAAIREAEAWRMGARSATDATARMIQRAISQGELIAHGQGNPPGWMGAIHQAKEFLNALRSDKPPGHSIRARDAKEAT